MGDFGVGEMSDDRGLRYLDWVEDETDHVKTYARGRRCCHDGCKTILSRYNGGEMCEMHTAPDYSRDCGFHVLTDRIIFGEKRCPTCGEMKPRNAEHFHRDESEPGGLSRECCECRNGAQRVNRKSHADYERTRYQTDPEYRERRKATSRENKARRYATDPEYRERVKAQARASKARCKAREAA